MFLCSYAVSHQYLSDDFLQLDHVAFFWAAGKRGNDVTIEFSSADLAQQLIKTM